jgi:arginine utilization regulatory protein
LHLPFFDREKIFFVEAMSKGIRRETMSLTDEKLKNILSAELFCNILDALDEGVMIVDRKCEIIFYNRTLSHFEGLKEKEVVGKSVFEVFPSISEQESTLYQVMHTGNAISEKFQHYINYQGRQFKTINTTLPIKSGEEVIGALEISRDISMLVNLTEKIADLQQKTAGKNKNPKNVGLRYSFDTIIGHSNKIREIIEVLKKVSRTSSSVLIYGETGTGKELFAQSIHNYGNRKNYPFVAQNCAALPESLLEAILFGTNKGSFTGAIDKAGLFEQANGGTLLLDEINSMSLFLQAKILRVLQEGVVRRLGGNEDIAVDVKIIATTNEKPVELMKSGKFREDLFYRLSVIYTELPPLRERLEDIPDMTDFFIHKYNQRFHKKVTGIDETISNIFCKYHWPGNVRELEHVIEAMMNFTDDGEITVRQLGYLSFGAFKSYVEAGVLTAPPKFKKGISNYEQNMILQILNETGGNISRAAEKMGIKRQALQYRLKKYNISAGEIAHRSWTRRR